MLMGRHPIFLFKTLKNKYLNIPSTPPFFYLSELKDFIKSAFERKPLQKFRSIVKKF